MSEAVAAQIHALRVEVTARMDRVEERATEAVERLEEKEEALARLVEKQADQLAEINALKNRGLGIVLAVTVFGALLAAGLKQWIQNALKGV